MSCNRRIELRRALEETHPGGHLRTVLHFYAFNLKSLEICYNKVRVSVEEVLQGRVKIESYGSLATGLALKESDIDLHLTPTTDPPIQYDEVVNRLRRSECFSEINPIRNARVPIIECRHNATGLNIDLNMSNPYGVYNSRFVAELLKCDRRLHELFLFLKIWATNLQLIRRGGLTSHCLVSMIIFSLQNRNILPSVQQMQASCPPIIFQGDNFAYNLLPPPMVPAEMTTRDLIRSFFLFYSTFDFGKFVVGPFLGRLLNRDRARLDFNLICNHNICVQDPFELKHDLAKSFDQQDLHYFRQCLELSAQALVDEDLEWQPKKLYDYLLFGIAEKLINTSDNQRVKQPTRKPKPTAEKLKNTPENQRVKQPTRKPKPTAEKLINTSENQRVKQPIRKPKKMQNSFAPPIPMTMSINVTNEDYLGLLPIREALRYECHVEATLLTWRSCQLATISDVLTKVYGLNIESEEVEQNSKRMLITGKVDTWTGRDFTRIAGQSFLSHQLEQSRNFSITRARKSYAVNVRAIMTVSWDARSKILQIDMKPTAGSLRNSSLEKLFHEFKLLLNEYSFEERASIWSLDRPSKDECLRFQIIFVVLFCLTLRLGPLFLIIVLLMAIRFWEFLKPQIKTWFYYCTNRLQFKENVINPKYPIYRKPKPNRIIF